MELRVVIKTGWLILRYGFQGAFEKAEEELAELTRKKRGLEEECKELTAELHRLQTINRSNVTELGKCLDSLDSKGESI